MLRPRFRKRIYLISNAETILKYVHKEEYYFGLTKKQKTKYDCYLVQVTDIMFGNKIRIESQGLQNYIQSIVRPNLKLSSADPNLYLIQLLIQRLQHLIIVPHD